ncbi:MAG: hypothetical protein AAFY15_07230, partial [Cyanobacteria bacterium J06648_11]
GTTLGFSPTLFGDFYSEAGIFGIIALSIVYGVAIASIVKYSTRLQPFASVLVRAMICSSLVPLLRGGDLAGIYAWLGMSFWPCLLLLILKRKQFELPKLMWRPRRGVVPAGLGVSAAAGLPFSGRPQGNEPTNTNP